MLELGAAAAAGLGTLLSVLALGGVSRPRHFEHWVLRAARAMVEREARVAAAAGFGLRAGSMAGLEVAVAASGSLFGYLLTGMPALAAAGGGLALGSLRGALGLRSTALRRERQDAVVAAVRTLRQLLETGAVLEESVTAAHEVEREAAALQVQARSASTLILCLPLAFLAVMGLLRSPYLDVYRTPAGQLFLAAMLAIMAAAHAVIRRWLRLPAEPRIELADA